MRGPVLNDRRRLRFARILYTMRNNGAYNENCDTYQTRGRASGVSCRCHDAGWLLGLWLDLGERFFVA